MASILRIDHDEGYINGTASNEEVSDRREGSDDNGEHYSDEDIPDEAISNHHEEFDQDEEYDTLEEMPYDEYAGPGEENVGEDGGSDEQFYSAREEGEDSEDVESDEGGFYEEDNVENDYNDGGSGSEEGEGDY